MTRTIGRGASRRLRAAAVVAVVLLASLAAAASILAYRPLPTIDADQRLIGLHERAEIVRDQDGVPHIFARDAHDLFFLQGYVTAQDRLFQMDLYRRTGRGTLSAVLGPSAIDTDTFSRTIGFLRAAKADEELLSDDGRLAAESYADGVNKFLEQHGESLPLEFMLLGYRPEPWTAVDSLVVLKLQSYDLATNFRSELLRADIALRLGAEALATLMPDPAGSPARATADGSWPLVAPLLSEGARAPAIAAYPGVFAWGEGLGSNCWALAGTRTASGKAMLAGDPHLTVRDPSIWYEIGLEGGGYRLAGFSIPGMPGIGIGHNARIAWSFTVAYADVQDLFVERVDPADPRRVLFRDAAEPIAYSREEIRVKGRADPVVVDVGRTRHGPILTPALKGQTALLALRWSALDPGRSLDALLGTARASDWSSFGSALARLQGAALSACYADVDGHVGYLLAGRLPDRAAGDGRLPAPGWTGDHEWRGYVPSSANPSLFDPPSGLVVNANDRPSADPKSPGYDGEWDPGFRAARLAELLGPLRGADAEKLRAIQMDLRSEPALRGRDTILSLRPLSPRGAAAQATVRRWDGVLDADAAGAAIYEAWLVRMIELTFRDKLGETLYADYLSGGKAAYAMYMLQARPDDAWFIELGDQSIRGRDELAAIALERALEDLAARLGPDPSSWRWGDLHRITFEHPLTPGLGPLAALFNAGPLPRAGDGFSVRQGAYSLAKPFAQTSHQSERMIVDLGDLDASWSVLPLGESGQPFSRHRTDQTAAWQDGRLHPMRFSRDRLGTPEGTLVFRPR